MTLGILSRLRRRLLGDDDFSRAERKLLFKIDWFILSYCCLMYFTNYLDRSNVNNAYVSGMREELHMVGTQFNQINTLFTCGYIVGMIPNNLVLQVVRPRIWLPAMQISWAILTFCTSVVSNVHQIYGIRFLQGMVESSTFVGVHYILGSWYKPGELGKRSAIFTCSGLVGTLFSGVLQGAVYKNLNGVDGRSGWRWLFLVDGIITLPIALYGFFVFPDLPTTTKAFYLTEEERLLSADRLEDVHDIKRHKLSWNVFKRVLGRWRWYGCSLLFAISGETESFGSNNLMGQYLSAIGGYTIEQVDYYPSGMTAFAIVSTLIAATLTDRNQKRWMVLIYMSVACIFAAICILVWSSPTWLKFVAFYVAGASYAGQATTFAWANQICADDDQERAIVLASMNMWNNVVNAWWPLVLYPATDAPRFRKGAIAMIAICVATLGVTWLVCYLERREKRTRAESAESARAGVDEKYPRNENRDSNEGSIVDRGEKDDSKEL